MSVIKQSASRCIPVYAHKHSDFIMRIIYIYLSSDIKLMIISHIYLGISAPHQFPNAIPYHKFILTGAGWIKGLLEGHPDCIWSKLGVHKLIFRILVAELQNAGYLATRNIMTEKQLVIFIYICVIGFSVHHIGE